MSLMLTAPETLLTVAKSKAQVTVGIAQYWPESKALFTLKSGQNVSNSGHTCTVVSLIDACYRLQYVARPSNVKN